MMRNKVVSSMQKTYDECYLMCSTAVFFEGQNNEAEALRSWKSALEQINYHNAYRVSASYIPRTETEKALFESLKQMELQCKERVDLLEALRQSRREAEKEDSDSGRRHRKSKQSNSSRPSGWLGDQTVPPMQYSDIPGPAPALPARPSIPSTMSSTSVNESSSRQSFSKASPLAPPPALPIPQNQKTSRSPSPDKSKRGLRKTLRPESKTKSSRTPSEQTKRPAPMKAAGLAWDIHPRAGSVPIARPESDPTIEARLSSVAARRSLDQQRAEQARWPEPRNSGNLRMPDPADYISPQNWRDVSSSSVEDSLDSMQLNEAYPRTISPIPPPLIELDAPPTPPLHTTPLNPVAAKRYDPIPSQLPKAPEINYRQEYLSQPSRPSPSIPGQGGSYHKQISKETTSSNISRKPVAPTVPPPRKGSQRVRAGVTTESDEEHSPKISKPTRRPKGEQSEAKKVVTPPSTDAESLHDSDNPTDWDARVKQMMKNLPKGVDEAAAKNILNEIVVKGDEVHWDDVAGLNGAKKALKEAVVYPFLRPDLFMGLREPARGMLLFGPPGTGKTMLARAVATESKSTFFAISASSLTSKWHGESEKLVRALFALAKALAPSIIFVDEIDSLLNSRGGGSEHEASRRSKTEFLIQWSDLQRAAAGKDTGVGDASRVLVLAATNCPWDIDDAARRRFVRRQYIPLPEYETRETQIRTLIGAQKHSLSDRDINRLVTLTDGYSGSDITALAKDAAMGPLRNLGEALLYTPMDQIRPIQMSDFESSLESIRPSVSKKGLEEFEEWAREYGERGG